MFSVIPHCKNSKIRDEFARESNKFVLRSKDRREPCMRALASYLLLQKANIKRRKIHSSVKSRNVQRSAKIDAPGCVNGAGKLRQM